MYVGIGRNVTTKSCVKYRKQSRGVCVCVCVLFFVCDGRDVHVHWRRGMPVCYRNFLSASLEVFLASQKIGPVH